MKQDEAMTSEQKGDADEANTLLLRKSSCR